jgi:L-ascorbate metabolism protein UlaG (beta-lactamase superfamily)
MSVSLYWIGGATMELRFGAFRLLTDPVLADGPIAFHMDGHPSTGADGVPIYRYAPVPPVDLDGLDALLLSHVHSDHFDAVARDRVSRELWGMAPASQVPRLESWGFDVVEGVVPGEEEHLERAGEILRITVLPAHHSHDALAQRELGDVNGYLIEHRTIRRTFRLVWTGDTVWSHDFAEAALQRGPVDVLVPHVGAVGRDGPWGLMTMDAEEAAHLIERIAPRRVVPVHHHTFSHYTEPVTALVDRLHDTRFSDSLRVVEEGERVVLD